MTDDKTDDKKASPAEEKPAPDPKKKDTVPERCHKCWAKPCVCKKPKTA